MPLPSIAPRPGQPWLALAALAPLGTIFLAISLLLSPEHWPRTPFSAEAWMKAYKYSRYIYVRDLADKNTLGGKSLDDVIHLLGNPSKQCMELFNCKSNVGDFIEYIVKKAKHDDWTLQVYFDKNLRVRCYRVGGEPGIGCNKTGIYSR
jgi:hypothetical protein